MFKTFTAPIKYGYATGRVKILETRLLGKPRLERVIAAKDLEEQRHILAETDYGPFFDEVTSETELEVALHRYLSRVYAFLEEVTPDSHLNDFFRLKYDFHNVKSLLKIRYLEEISEIFSGLGKFDVDEVEGLVMDEKFDELPQVYRPAVKEAVAKFKENKDPQQIDTMLDKCLFEELYRLALLQKNRFMSELVQILIDLANLKIFLRAKKLKKEELFLWEVLIDKGSIEKDTLISWFDQPLTHFYAQIEKTPYHFLKETANAEKIDLTYFDKLADNFYLNFIKRARYETVGIEPILGYILAKENEAKVLRIIFKAKFLALPVPEIEARMRELYV